MEEFFKAMVLLVAIMAPSAVVVGGIYWMLERSKKYKVNTRKQAPSYIKLIK